MVQVKKQSARNAILHSAHGLFIKQGYADTSMTEIARRARMSTANLYTYFDSKLEIFFAIYETWLSAFIDELEKKAESARDPRERVETILTALWKELPAKNNGFSNNLIQALAMKRPDERYSRKLLLESEERIYELLKNCLPDQSSRKNVESLTHLLFMAMDGFVVNYHLNASNPDVDTIIRAAGDLLLTQR